MAAPTEILACPLALRGDAIELVLRELSPEQQVALVGSLSHPSGKSLGPFDALYIAIREMQLVAAVWAQPQPGRAATLWLPQFSSASVKNKHLAHKLIAIATRRVREFDTAVLQALLEPSQTTAPRLLLNAGFFHVANLNYLEWSPPVGFQAKASTVQLETYNMSKRERLKAVLSQSYLRSLDCPQLDALRTLDDTLAGYQATGQFDPNLWMLATAGQQDVGALLMAPFPQTGQMELIYMGVVPEARGRGIGAALTAHAQAVAAERRVEKIVLAVDDANRPALRLYRHAGFREWSRRSAYVRSMSPRE